MVTEAFRDQIRMFIRERIAGAGELDVVLFLVEHSTRSWAADEVAASVGRPVDAVTAELRMLSSTGLVDCDGVGQRYRYVVSDDEEDRLLRDLAELRQRNSRTPVGAGTAHGGVLARLTRAFGRHR